MLDEDPRYNNESRVMKDPLNSYKGIAEVQEDVFEDQLSPNASRLGTRTSNNRGPLTPGRMDLSKQQLIKKAT